MLRRSQTLPRSCQHQAVASVVASGASLPAFGQIKLRFVQLLATRKIALLSKPKFTGATFPPKKNIRTYHKALAGVHIQSLLLAPHLSQTCAQSKARFIGVVRARGVHRREGGELSTLTVSSTRPRVQAVSPFFLVCSIRLPCFGVLRVGPQRWVGVFFS